MTRKKTIEKISQTEQYSTRPRTGVTISSDKQKEVASRRRRKAHTSKLSQGDSEPEGEHNVDCDKEGEVRHIVRHTHLPSTCSLAITPLWCVGQVAYQECETQQSEGSRTTQQQEAFYQEREVC